MRLKILPSILLISMALSAQDSPPYGDLNLLLGASNPALSLIGYEARVIMYPKDPVDIAFNVSQLTDSLNKGPGTFSLEVAPYWFMPSSSEMSYAEFARGGGPSVSIPQTLTFSLAFSNEIEDIRGTAIAIGVQASLMRSELIDASGKLDTLRAMHTYLSKSSLILADSLQEEDSLWTYYNSLLIEDPPIKQRVIIERLRAQRNTVIMHKIQAELDATITATREYVENFGFTRSGPYLDFACGIVEVFEDDDYEANSVYRYGCWITGGYEVQPFVLGTTLRYLGYHYGDKKTDIDAGMMTSYSLSQQLELSCECLLRHSELRNGESESTYRFDFALTVPIFRHSAVTITLGRDFGESGENSLVTVVNFVTGIGSLRPLPI